MLLPGIWRKRRCMSYAAENDGVTEAETHPRPPRLLDQVRQRVRAKHYSLRTEQAYLGSENGVRSTFHGTRPKANGVGVSYLTGP